MRFRLDEKGSTLTLVLLISAVFAIIGLTLISTTINGAKKTNTREAEVQATYLAEKGMDYTAAKINNKLKTDIGNGILVSQFPATFTNVIIFVKGQVIGKTINPSGNGTYTVKDIQFTDTSSTTPNRKSVTIQVEANVKNQTKLLKRTIFFGTGNAPEILKYALGSFCLSKNCLPGEGNMYLQGASQIKGDLYVANNLFVKDSGPTVYNYNYSYGTYTVPYWNDTLSPQLIPNDSSTKSKIALGGNLFTFTDAAPFFNFNFSGLKYESEYRSISNYYQAHLNTPDVTNSFYQNVTNSPANYFTSSVPSIVKSNFRPPIIEIAGKRNSYKYNWNDSGVSPIPLPNNRMNDSNTLYKSLKIYPYDKKGTNFDSFILEGNNTINQFSFPGNTEITGQSNKISRLEFTNGAYIGGDLEIGSKSASNNPNTYPTIQIRGPIFVDGDLTINNVNAQFASLIYVTGKTTIEYSTLNGLNEALKPPGSLIVFSKGEINIQNNSLYHDNPSYLKGFFYSEGDIEMYGVGSNISIDGGLSARKIILNALAGKYANQNQEALIKSSDINLSRLKINYDPDIIETYANLKESEPMITNLDEPAIVEPHMK